MIGKVLGSVVVLVVASLVSAARPGSGAPGSKPHIVVVMADDLGWADTGYRREVKTPEIQTPTLDALVAEGIDLRRQMVHQMCTPTRSSFQSGRLPVHVQLTLAGPCNPNNGIPRNMTCIASKMKSGGYATHQVGKWDAGMMTPTHTPHGRGYDTALSYFSHGTWSWTEAEWQGSYTHSTSIPECNPPDCAIDMWDTDRPASHLNGTIHAEYLYRNRWTSILDSHDTDTPLFLVYTPKLCHYPLQAPEEYQSKFSFIDEDHRRTYHAMVNFLDDQVANLTSALKAKGMWDNTLLVFTTDNGGYVKADLPCINGTAHGTACDNGEAGANNYPLRGGKYSLFEGGVRGNAFISGGIIPASKRGTVSTDLVHVADWYATFCKMAGVDPSDPWAAASGLPPVDSLDVWPVLSGQASASPRSTILITDEAIIHNQYKLIVTGAAEGAGWSGPQYPNYTTIADGPIDSVHADCKTGCLFDVVADPSEYTDLAASKPEVVSMMMAMLKNESASIFKRPSQKNSPLCMKTAFDRWGGFLGPFAELP